MGAMTRNFLIPAIGEEPDISLDIHEPALTGGNLGLKTWGSAYVLAKHLSYLGDKYLPLPKEQLDTKPSVLELGSGTGLVGLAAAAIWKCKIILTDLPEIVPNLEHNRLLNQAQLELNGGEAAVFQLDWSKHPIEYPSGETFDVSSHIFIS